MQVKITDAKMQASGKIQFHFFPFPAVCNYISLLFVW